MAAAARNLRPAQSVGLRNCQGSPCAAPQPPPIALDSAHAASALAGPTTPPVAEARQGGLDIAVRLERAEFWVVLTRPGHGGLALRMPAFSSDARCRSLPAGDALAAITCEGALGTARLVVRGDPFGLEQVRATLDFTPRADLALA